jgi:hypothetical protein
MGEPQKKRPKWLAVLETFDIPPERLDISKITNVNWLIANIRVNNSEHEHVDSIIAILKKQFYTLRKKG